MIKEEPLRTILEFSQCWSNACPILSFHWATPFHDAMGIPRAVSSVVRELAESTLRDSLADPAFSFTHSGKLWGDRMVADLALRVPEQAMLQLSDWQRHIGSLSIYANDRTLEVYWSAISKWYGMFSHGHGDPCHLASPDLVSANYRAYCVDSTLESRILTAFRTSTAEWDSEFHQLIESAAVRWGGAEYWEDTKSDYANLAYLMAREYSFHRFWHDIILRLSPEETQRLQQFAAALAGEAHGNEAHPPHLPADVGFYVNA